MNPFVEPPGKFITIINEQPSMLSSIVHLLFPTKKNLNQLSLLSISTHVICSHIFYVGHFFSPKKLQKKINVKSKFVVGFVVKTNQFFSLVVVENLILDFWVPFIHSNKRTTKAKKKCLLACFIFCLSTRWENDHLTFAHIHT